MFQAVRRACYAGHDSVTLRRRVAEELAAVLPFDAYTFATTDPDTGLLTHMVSEGVPPAVGRAWLEELYPERVAREILDMARVGPLVTATCSDMVRDVLRAEGLAHDLRSILSTGSDPLGFLCLLRGPSSGGFTSREVDFLKRLRPHLVRGLQSAGLVDRATDGTLRSPIEHEEEPGPLVLVLDRGGHIQLKSRTAASLLEDLGDVGPGPEPLPCSVASVAAHLTELHSRAWGDGSALPLEAKLHTRGRSGRWYTIRASLTEPDAHGASSTIVLVQKAGSEETAAILTRLYGLTSREREVLAHVAKGTPTKAIARLLGISPYTVQEHLSNACSKVGVRTRKALVAKIFLEGYAPSITPAAS